MRIDPEAAAADLAIQTLGRFRLWREGRALDEGAFVRDKALQLFQFLLTLRGRLMEREGIVERLWPELDPESGERDFKVAHSHVLRAIEPDRPPRSESRFLRRAGTAYGLATEGIWIDFEALESALSEGNRRFPQDPKAAAASYRRVADLYRGDFLPDRRYEDWASAEQERLQLLSLGAMANLAALVLYDNPLESLHLAQRIREVDPFWEEAWRLEMRAHMARGNRALAIEAWERCRASLEEGMGLPPLPDTEAVYEAARRGEGVGWAGDPAGAAAGPSGA